MATEQGRKYAIEAMKELIRSATNPYESAQYLAKKAWEFSDEMMEQEKIRE